MPSSDYTKFGALDRSVTNEHKIGHKEPDYLYVVYFIGFTACMCIVK